PTGVSQEVIWTTKAIFHDFIHPIHMSREKVRPVLHPNIFGDKQVFSNKKAMEILGSLDKKLVRSEFNSHNNNAAQYFKLMPEAYVRTLWAWTTSIIYKRVTKAMLSSLEGKKLPEKIALYVELINDAIHNAPDYVRHKGASTRAIFNDKADADAFIAKIHKIEATDGIYNNETISSSTKGDKPALFRGLVHVHYHGKTGVYINAISDSPGLENEVLFGTKQKFKVGQIEKIGNSTHVHLLEI
ncbi:MAG: hypothetical protein R8K21_08300, partial [Mariprofundales bacterium]